MNLKNSLFLLLGLFFACNPQEISPSIDQAVTGKESSDSGYKFGNIVFQDSSAWVLMPLNFPVENKSRKILSSSYGGRNYSCWNYLFLDPNSNQQRLLTDQKALFINLQHNIRGQGRVLDQSILYRTKTVDYNQDDELDGRDPTYLWRSDLTGQQLIQLSPAHEHVQEYYLIPNTDKIIFTTLQDSNQDLKFDASDQLVWYELDLAVGGPPNKLLDPTIATKINQLYQTYWTEKE